MNTRFGSSPYTRGTHARGYHQPVVERFIPVHTGNSLKEGVSIDGISVHPRTHGELINQRKDEMVSVGSSPYTRGTQVIQSLIYPR